MKVHSHDAVSLGTFLAKNSLYDFKNYRQICLKVIFEKVEGLKEIRKHQTIGRSARLKLVVAFK